MTEEEATTAAGLPPLMGFPQEEYYNGGGISVAYYVCLIGQFLVYVYCPSGMRDNGWRIECKIKNPKQGFKEQFFGGGREDKYELEHNDPIALMAIIREITK